ncbi:MAG TPA: YXWGXW repeat-containing protein [Chitinophagaceae bacterium]|nr:YXWGXW repeat-containing protein [Chitinophagaceae bacterium]
MKKSFILVALVLGMGLFGGCMVSGGFVTSRPADITYVRPVAPGTDYVWIDGDWYWAGGAYVWHEGHWAKPRGGRAWVPGRWQSANRGWRWRKGHWR